jgi:hypothetical protein
MCDYVSLLQLPPAAAPAVSRRCTLASAHHVRRDFVSCMSVLAVVLSGVGCCQLSGSVHAAPHRGRPALHCMALFCILPLWCSVSLPQLRFWCSHVFALRRMPPVSHFTSSCKPTYHPLHAGPQELPDGMPSSAGCGTQGPYCCCCSVPALWSRTLSAGIVCYC